MGGRGSASAAGKTSAESKAQLSDAQKYAERAGATAVRYTDENGNITESVLVGRGKWVNQPITQSNRIYNAQYSPNVAEYAKMSTTDLKAELKRQQDISTSSYVKFTRAAASRSGSEINAASAADVRIKEINQVLRRRK